MTKSKSISKIQSKVEFLVAARRTSKALAMLLNSKKKAEDSISSAGVFDENQQSAESSPENSKNIFAKMKMNSGLTNEKNSPDSKKLS